MRGLQHVQDAQTGEIHVRNTSHIQPYTGYKRWKLKWHDQSMKQDTVWMVELECGYAKLLQIIAPSAQEGP